MASEADENQTGNIKFKNSGLHWETLWLQTLKKKVTIYELPRKELIKVTQE